MAGKMRVTKEQYYSLNPMAKELHDYWMNFKTEMYNTLADSGKLWPLLKSEGDRLDEMVIELTPQIGLAGAKEIAREEIYDQTEEETEEEDPDEETEQDRQHREMWETYCEMRQLLDEMRNLDPNLDS